MKELVIEIPTCDKQRFESYYENNLQEIVKITGIYNISYNILFQKEYTKEDIDRYVGVFNRYGIEMRYKIEDYIEDRRKFSLVDMRESCHSIYTCGDYVLSLDDDIEFLDGYSDDLVNALSYMDSHEEYSLFNISNAETVYNYYGCDYKLTINEITGKKVHTHGGILIRGCEKIFPDECKGLVGCGQDELLGLLCSLRGDRVGLCLSGNYLHYEHRKKIEDCGIFNRGWCAGVGLPNSIDVWIKNRINTI